MATMIAINSVFAAYEIALASLSLPRLQRLAEDKRRGAKVALYMKRNIEASLAVVQLGITLVGAIAAAVGGAGAEEKLTPILMGNLGMSEGAAEILALGLVVAPLTVLTIMVGELIPKVFALRNAESVCLVLSPFMRGFSFSVWPAVRLFEILVLGVMSWSERRRGAGTVKPKMAELQELRAAAALVRSSRLIGHREERIILGATELQRPVRDIMLAAPYVSALDANATLADSLIAAHLDMHTRFPVVERKDDLQSAIGYVNAKDIVAAMHLSPSEPTLRAITRDIPSFRDDQAIAECLDSLMRERTHIALIRDSEGRVAGMISLEDILEELVGEIEDEFDRLPSHLVATGSSWVVGGGILLDRLKSLTHIDLAAATPAANAHTLSDWVLRQLGREAHGGDVIEQGLVRVLVRKVRRRKVQEAQVSSSR